jgi:hypothetical protein
LSSINKIQPEQRDLLLKIATKCGSFAHYFLHENNAKESNLQEKSSLCAPLLDSRSSISLLPTPWCGHINSPIMFISSNPAFNEDEKSPTTDFGVWNDDQIVDFFENRFDPNNRWTRVSGDDIEFLLTSGKYKKQPFWKSIINRAVELQQIVNPYLASAQFRGLKNCVLTEIVHCGSKKDKGVKDVKDFCEPFLDRILTIATQVSAIFIVGDKALGRMNTYFTKKPGLENIDLDWHPYPKCSRKKPAVAEGIIGKRKVIFIAIPHQSNTNNKYKMTLERCLTESEIQIIRQFFKEKELRLLQ